jgi:hypothetical protein
MRQLDFTHVLAALAGVVLTLAGMGVFMFFNSTPNVNEQLAQTTQQAVESADQAHQQSVTMHAAIGRYRLIGAGVGIAAALGLAGLALWLAWRSEPEAVELLEQHHRLIDEHRSLPTPAKRRRLQTPVDQRRLK